MEVSRHNPQAQPCLAAGGIGERRDPAIAEAVEIPWRHPVERSGVEEDGRLAAILPEVGRGERVAPLLLGRPLIDTSRALSKGDFDGGLVHPQGELGFEVAEHDRTVEAAGDDQPHERGPVIDLEARVPGIAMVGMFPGKENHNARRRLLDDRPAFGAEIEIGAFDERPETVEERSPRRGVGRIVADRGEDSDPSVAAAEARPSLGRVGDVESIGRDRQVDRPGGDLPGQGNAGDREPGDPMENGHRRHGPATSPGRERMAGGNHRSAFRGGGVGKNDHSGRSVWWSWNAPPQGLRRRKWRWSGGSAV